MKRRTAVRSSVFAAVIVVVGGFALYTWANPVDIGSPTTRFSVLTADFGFRRTQLTRSFDLYLCSPAYADLDAVECRTNSTGGSDSPGTASRLVRPEIVSTTVGGELVQVDNTEPIRRAGGCKYLPGGAQFPSSQVKAVAENRGAADLVVSLVADSSQPEEVRPGTYCGAITVARSTGNDVPLYVLPSVGDRGQGALRIRIFFALLFGALMGATVKWLGDRYAPVAGLRRRQRRLLRRFGGWRRHLPERAQYDLAVIEDGIGSFDPEGVDTCLAELEQYGDALTLFSSAMAELDELIADQEQVTDELTPPMSHVLAAEYAHVARLRAAKFPWDEPDTIAADADNLRNAAKAIAMYLDVGDASSYQEAAEEMVGSIDHGQAQRAAAHQGRLGLRHPAATPAPVRVMGSESRNFAQILLDNSLLITMIVGAFVVAFVGFQTQFVADTSFDAGTGDYIRLVAWAFALQVAGVTVLEVAGKLVTSAASSTVPQTKG